MKNKRGIALILLACLCVGTCAGCTAEEEAEADFSRISDICELATLQCYYHNVAKTEENAYFLKVLKNLGIGYKEYWIEYSGIVEYGIDVSQVAVSEPDAAGVVTVTLPAAEVLDVDIDEDSFGEELVKSGLFTSVSADEKTTVLSAAQDSMEEEAAENTELLNQAEERAKDMIENYIVKVGEQIGEGYTVEWVTAE